MDQAALNGFEQAGLADLDWLDCISQSGLIGLDQNGQAGLEWSRLTGLD